VVNGERVIIKKTKSNREIEFLCKLRNVSGVVHYKSYFFDDQYVYTVLEKIRHTIDLYDYITKCNGYLSEALTKTILKQLIGILMECRQKGILHNDIKETNILINPLSKKITLIDFDAAEVEAQIREGLKGWPVSENAKISYPKVAMPEKFTQKIISNPEAVQMQFYMGHVGIRRNDPDYFKLMVMDYILGTGPGFTDRLSARLRDREGLAYTVNANITSTADIEPGVFTCYIGTDAGNFDRVKKEFLEELERIRTTKPTEDELSDAKNYLLGNLAFRFTTNAAIASQLLMVERLGIGLDYLDKFRKEVSAVTGDDIKAVAFKHIQTEKLIEIEQLQINIFNF
jgi:serine/threonine protein kinase